MSTVSRVVRRSLTIASLGILIATALASPDTGAVPVEPGTMGQGYEVELDSPMAVQDLSVNYRVLGAVADDLLVGHGDVLRLYRAFFRRDPDPTGAVYWLDQFDSGAGVDAIAFSFANSAEFKATYGDTTDADFVRIVYGNVLGREPDQAGFGYWTELVSTPAVSRTDVVRWVSASSEFIGQHPYRRPAVEAAIARSGEMATAIDALEGVVGQRPTAALPSDRSSALVAAVDRLAKRFGRFSAVLPAGACWTTGRTAKCPVEISEVGLAQTFTVTVAQRQVVDIDEAANELQWADDALRTMVTGRAVAGSRALPAETRESIALAARRIRPTIGSVGQATSAHLGCEDGEIRTCRFEVVGPVYRVEVELDAVDGALIDARVEVPRRYTATGFSPFASIGSVTLHHPADRVERIGFHESAHDGARQQDPLVVDTTVATMASRNRGNGSRTAADIAVHPEDEIRSPVTGTVLRAGTYVLYCRHEDHFLVIEPDARPGYEVKMLHFEGLAVEKGQRVTAGITTVGSKVRKLPFESQIDKSTADPSSGHIHIEVVDPSIPDRPSGGGC